jgi:hypothetical protein
MSLSCQLQSVVSNAITSKLNRVYKGITLHKIIELCTKWSSICQNITSKFRIIAIFKSFVKDKNARFQVLAMASMKNRDFWDIMPCSLVEDRRFRCVYCLHHQGFRGTPVEKPWSMQTF